MSRKNARQKSRKTERQTDRNIERNWVSEMDEQEERVDERGRRLLGRMDRGRFSQGRGTPEVVTSNFFRLFLQLNKTYCNLE
jgi:hypothetical protein